MVYSSKEIPLMTMKTIKKTTQPSIHLFVQDGCRPCHYVKGQLAKVDNWESVITLTNSKQGDEWTNFAKQSGVVATPTLVAYENGKVVARQSGSQSFTSDFFKGLIDKFNARA